VYVDSERKEIGFVNGRKETYDMLINMSPLDLFVGSLFSAPEEVSSATKHLVHNGGLIVGLVSMVNGRMRSTLKSTLTGTWASINIASTVASILPKCCPA